MSNTPITKQIQKIALELIAEENNGIKYSQLIKNIIKQNSDFKYNTIQGVLVGLQNNYPNEIYKPDRGIFRSLKYKENIEIQSEQQPQITTKNNIKEENFYKPFADWLVNELEECTKAMELGGNIFKDKWGTPDVIGIRKSNPSDIIKLPTEIISGEIKTDSNGLITAFGQACAYKIFSHKSYIVIPNDSQIEDMTRLDTLCRQFGIGLILFNNQNPEDSNFEIRTRAIKHEPDMFFMNKNLKSIEKLF